MSFIPRICMYRTAGWWGGCVVGWRKVPCRRMAAIVDDWGYSQYFHNNNNTFPIFSLFCFSTPLLLLHHTPHSAMSLYLCLYPWEILISLEAVWRLFALISLMDTFPEMLLQIEGETHHFYSFQYLHIPLDMPRYQRISCTVSLFSSPHATSLYPFYSRGEGIAPLYAIPVHFIPPTTARCRQISSLPTQLVCVYPWLADSLLVEGKL